MKKVVCLVLCALLLAALPTSALAAEGDVLLHCGSQEDAISGYIDTACAVGDTLYMADYEGAIYTISPSDVEPKRYAGLSEYGELDYNEYVTRFLLSDGERPLVLSFRGDAGEFKEAALFALELSDGTARVEKLKDVSNTLEYNGFRSAVSLGEYALIRCYGMNGEDGLARFNLSDGTLEPATFAHGDIYALTPYTEERALIEVYDYDQPTAVRFYTYDPATDTSEELGTVEIEEYEPLGTLVCDPANGDVYCVKGGEIRSIDLTTGQLGDPLASIPADNLDNAWILPSGYFACASSGVCALRNIRGGSMEVRRLVIADNSYESSVERSYYAFQSEHGEVNAVLSRDDMGDLIEKMMNRDASVDIYVIQASSAEFEAIRDRGYMADLTQSEALTALAERMYPTLREDLSSNGALAALPVSAYFWQMYVNEAAWEKLGKTAADVPSNWSDFLDFLIELQTDFPQDGSVTLLDPYNDAAMARRELLNAIFENYQQMLARDPDSVSVQTMVELLTKLEQIDFTRLGHPVETADNYDDNRNSAVLLTTGIGTTLSGLIDPYYGTPVVMSLTPDSAPLLALECTVAFINPYSENADLALAYMEKLAENLSDDILYTVCPDLTEPVLDPYYETNLRNAEEQLAQLQKAYDEAEPIDKQALEQQLQYAQEYVETARAQRYSISEEEIAWLRGHGDEMSVKGANLLYSDDSGEAYELVNQYSEGKISASQLMKSIDGKLRMMILEGR